MILLAIEMLSSQNKSINGSIIQSRELGEYEVLLAKFGKSTCHQGDGIGTQAMLRSAPGVQLTQHQISLQGSDFGVDTRDSN